MISSTDAYKAAVIATTRRTRLKIAVDISDPDMVFTGVAAADQADISVPGQLADKTFDLARYATLERNRWLLDGSFGIFDDNYAAGDAEIGGVSESVSGDDGTLSTPLWFELQFANVSILQVCAVWFSSDEVDGRPVDFTVEVRQGGTAFYTQGFTGNTADHVMLTGFTVYNPDAIRVTVTKWSTPHRRMRLAEIIPGVYEQWTDDKVTDLKVQMNGDPSCVSLPYGTCTLAIDNTDKMFEPRNKNGIFQSLQERQGIGVSIGVKIGGGYDYKSAGVFYQYNGGWTTSDNGMTIQWNLVDIIGLLTEREYVPPDTIPTTVTGWVQSILSMLGPNFVSLYTIDPQFENVALTATRDGVTGVKCGDMVRYICMAIGAWARADAETGKLAIEPTWDQGNRMDLDNMERYPVIQANEDVAQFIFTLADNNNTQYIVGGNNISSTKSVSITNPFISTTSAALAAAQNMVIHFGGDVYSLVARGDPSNEIGDVATLELDEKSATTARIKEQSFSFSRQVLAGCDVKLVQATGKLTYTARDELTASGTWTVPSGVTTLRLVLVGGGDGGTKGGNGSWSSRGEDGEDGIGGAVWWGDLSVNPGAMFSVVIGQGGEKNGGRGGNTYFGSLSSASGQVYSPSYTDITEGNAYGRTGVVSPQANSGDGGAKGAGGAQGERHEVTEKDLNGFIHYRTVTDSRPKAGKDGTAGASGCVVIYYDKPE